MNPGQWNKMKHDQNTSLGKIHDAINKSLSPEQNYFQNWGAINPKDIEKKYIHRAFYKNADEYYNQDIREGAAKHDGDKIRMELLPPEFTYATAAALTYGAKKYSSWNWSKGLHKGRIMGALLRHAFAYLANQDHDPGSNLPHTWHMAACLAMLIGCEARGTAIEDRQDARHILDYVDSHYTQMKDPSQDV